MTIRQRIREERELKKKHRRSFEEEKVKIDECLAFRSRYQRCIPVGLRIYIIKKVFKFTSTLFIYLSIFQVEKLFYSCLIKFSLFE